MGVPFLQGGYSFTELYAASNRVWRTPINVPNPPNSNVNVLEYAALRLNVADSQSNVIISISTNASTLTATNANYITTNANASTMNVSAGSYQFDFDGLRSGVGWETVTTGTIRIDSSN
jgi:hypothetical protein